MIKVYCDKCGKEISENQCRKISINIEYPNNKSTYISDFCDDCMNEIISLVGQDVEDSLRKERFPTEDDLPF